MAVTFLVSDPLRPLFLRAALFSLFGGPYSDHILLLYDSAIKIISLNQHLQVSFTSFSFYSSASVAWTFWDLPPNSLTVRTCSVN